MSSTIKIQVRRGRFQGENLTTSELQRRLTEMENDLQVAMEEIRDLLAKKPDRTELTPSSLVAQ